MDFGSKFVYFESDEEEVEEKAPGHGRKSESSDEEDDGESCLLDILDTAGQEEYSALRDTYTREGDCFVIVYSITDTESFKEAESLYQFLQTVKDVENPAAVLCGNKSDLDAERKISAADGAAMAAKLKIPFIETSAKMADNIKQLFETLIRSTPRPGISYKVLSHDMPHIRVQAARNAPPAQMQFQQQALPDVQAQANVAPPPPPPQQSMIGSLFNRLKGSMKKAPDSGDSGEEARQPKPTGPAKLKKVRKADGNVLLLKLDILEDEPSIVTGDPVYCGSCRAILSSISTLEADGEHTTWTCEFCGHKNGGLDMSPEEIPQGDSIDFVIIPARTDDATADEATAGETTPEKKEESEGMVVYCMDISSSMGASLRLPELQAQWRRARDHTNSGDMSISRLQAIKDAARRQLERLKIEHPNKQVALVTFGSTVYVWGDCHNADPQTFSGACLNNYDDLIQIGRDYATDMELNMLEHSHSNLDRKIEEFEVTGCTALGPALAISAGIIASSRMSEVVLCTDGEPNVGVGNLDSDGGIQFYKKIGEFAKSNKTKLSVLAIEGQETGLQHVQQCAIVSGGTINVLNPLEMMRQLRLISQNYIVATAVDVTVILPTGLIFDEPGYRVATNKLVKEVGNATKEMDLTFRYKAKDAKNVAGKTTIPFQVQLNYTLKNGMRALRILSKSHQVTQDRNEMEEGLNVAILGVAAVQKSAAVAAKGDVKQAKEHMESVQRMMKRGAKTSIQKEERYAFRVETDEMMDELCEAEVYDDVHHRSDKRSNMLSNMGQISSNKYHGSSGAAKQMMMQKRKAPSSLQKQYYDYKS